MQETAEELEKLQEAVLRPLFEKKQVDKFRLRELCREIGGIPSSLRPKVWPILLGVVSNNANIGTKADVRLWRDSTTSRDLKSGVSLKLMWRERDRLFLIFVRNV